MESIVARIHLSETDKQKLQTRLYLSNQSALCCVNMFVGQHPLDFVALGLAWRASHWSSI